MNRRNFLRSLVGGVTATAAIRTWPFRVFSFPSEIKPAYFVPEFSSGTWGAIDRTSYPGRLGPFVNVSAFEFRAAICEFERNLEQILLKDGTGNI